MKKLIFTILMFLLAFSLNAQVKFLDIPVDGSKSKMITKLKHKGFKYNKDLDYLTGEFDGENVMISIIDNKNKVSGITVIFGSHFGDYSMHGYSKRVAKNRFNDLIYRFDHNDKYLNASFIKNNNDCTTTISDDEDIDYQIKYNNREYHAYYTQLGDKQNNVVHFKIVESSNEGDYFVVLRYDNLDNRPKGEDL